MTATTATIADVAVAVAVAVCSQVEKGFVAASTFFLAYVGL